jgi:protein gp37
MSTKIEWTDQTWNPTTGCNKISAGCKNCYAEPMHKRLKGMGQPKYQTDFNKGVQTWEDELLKPLKWKKPRKVFVNSMSDLFHEDVPFFFIDKVFAIMALTPQHTYQVLTKRADRMSEYFSQLLKQSNRVKSFNIFTGLTDEVEFPLPNVWLGTSVENQEQADKRIPHLLSVPAAVRFLSCEPLLGRVDLKNIKGNAGSYYQVLEPVLNAGDSSRPSIDWVIAGGESGHDARPMHPDWVRSLRDQCQAAGVPFFFKQWGEWMPIGTTDGLQQLPFGNYNIDTKFGFSKVGKKAAGRMLDGREWNKYPKIEKS